MPVQGDIHETYEDIYDALRHAVQALGGAKLVGARLWPHKPVAEAQRELLDALNRERPRKLDPEETVQVLHWAREAGFHSAKHFIDAATGYTRSVPEEPEDELAKLIREYLDIERRRLQLQPAIEQRLKVAK